MDSTSALDLAGAALAIRQIEEKAQAATQLYQQWRAGAVRNTPPRRVLDPDEAGIPDRPSLVEQRQLAKRSYGTPQGRAAVLHALAHIEANAINLALDAAHRFSGLPDAFVEDWLRIAADESRHYLAVVEHLHRYGIDYGDLVAHRGLWNMATSTADDLLERMALVPRFLEARGLDVGPPMIAAFRRSGDEASADLVEMIITEEEDHVRCGNRWFRWEADRRGLNAEAEFSRILRGRQLWLAPPVNNEARRRVGFSRTELDALRHRAEDSSHRSEVHPAT